MGFSPGHREPDETEPLLCDIRLHRHKDLRCLPDDSFPLPLRFTNELKKRKQCCLLMDFPAFLSMKIAFLEIIRAMVSNSFGVLSKLTADLSL